jgi:hypothetical protein
MVGYKCHGCGDVKEYPKQLKEWVCTTCGCINVVENYSPDADNVCDCVPPKGFEWKFPSGVKEDVMGNKIYISAQGTEMTKEQFMDSFGFDPDIALARMRELGSKGKEGYVNCSTLGRQHKPPVKLG